MPTKNNKLIDLTGQTFGRLTVLNEGKSRYVRRNPRKYRGATTERIRRWDCLCECGNYTTVNFSALRSGDTQSCGCRKQEHIKRLAKRGLPIDSVNVTELPEYHLYFSMKDRCYNPNNTNWEYYGGRGITMCDRWLESFHNFVEDMGERPSKKHSVERLDNNKGYSPENCKWATRKEQMNNTRRCHMLTFQGKTQSLTMWCEELHLSISSVRYRLKQKWSLENALTIPTNGTRNPDAVPRKGRTPSTAKLTPEQVQYIRQTYKPHSYTQRRLAKELNVDASTISNVIRGKYYNHA